MSSRANPIQLERLEARRSLVFYKASHPKEIMFCRLYEHFTLVCKFNPKNPILWSHCLLFGINAVIYHGMVELRGCSLTNVANSHWQMSGADFTPGAGGAVRSEGWEGWWKHHIEKCLVNLVRFSLCVWILNTSLKLQSRAIWMKLLFVFHMCTQYRSYPLSWLIFMVVLSQLQQWHNFSRFYFIFSFFP